MISKKDLAMRDYVVCIDRSGSMSDKAKSTSSQSRWDVIKEATLALVRVCEKLDENGMDVYFFNTNFVKHSNVTSDKVKELFDKIGPNGGTDFVPVLKDALDTHFKNADKPTTILVVTDGTPSEDDGRLKLAQLIVDTTKKMEADAELGISFIQIGEDKGAREFLKSLDDELTSKGAKFDIVDTLTMDEMANKEIEEVLLAAVND